MKLLYSEVVQGWGWARDGHGQAFLFLVKTRPSFLGFLALEGCSLLAGDFSI